MDIRWCFNNLIFFCKAGTPARDRVQAVAWLIGPGIALPTAQAKNLSLRFGQLHALGPVRRLRSGVCQHWNPTKQKLGKPAGYVGAEMRVTKGEQRRGGCIDTLAVLISSGLSWRKLSVVAISCCVLYSRYELCVSAALFLFHSLSSAVHSAARS